MKRILLALILVGLFGVPAWAGWTGNGWVNESPSRAVSTTILLNGATAVGAGVVVQVPIYRGIAVQATGIGSATVKLQGSLDDTNWVDLATFTSDGGTTITSPWKYLRGNVTVYTTGTIYLYIGY